MSAIAGRDALGLADAMSAVPGQTDSFDPLAAALDNEISALTLAEQDHVFKTVLSACGYALSERAELAVAALRACAAASGRPPSRAAYSRWRAQQERPQEWPSTTFILHCFRISWIRALLAAGLEPEPARLAQQRALQRGGFSPEELLTGIRACVAALGDERPLTFARYRTWAKAQAVRAQESPSGAAAMSCCLQPHAFIRAFGSWRNARTTALAGL